MRGSSSIHDIRVRAAGGTDRRPRGGPSALKNVSKIERRAGRRDPYYISLRLLVMMRRRRRARAGGLTLAAVGCTGSASWLIIVGVRSLYVSTLEPQTAVGSV